MLIQSGPFEGLRRNGYGTILADPPWGFVTYDQRLALPQRTRFGHYGVMTPGALEELPVADLAAKNAVLHMWVVSSHVHRAYALAAAWGFEPKALGMVWVKTQKTNPDVPKMGMGFWFRQECEVSLVFTRGKPPRRDMGVRQVIMEPAREHSRKPDGQYERIERLSDGPYVELFARQWRPNWSAWGDEIDKYGGDPEIEALI